jgi:hypothetical protein
VGQEAAIANGPPQQYVDVYTQAQVSGSCLWATSVGAGKLALKRALYKEVPGGWWKCKWTGWKFNTSATSYMYMSKQWPSPGPCGEGNYQTRGWGKVYKNGVWHQGNRWSGAVHFG